MIGFTLLGIRSRPRQDFNLYLELFSLLDIYMGIFSLKGVKCLNLSPKLRLSIYSVDYSE